MPEQQQLEKPEPYRAPPTLPPATMDTMMIDMGLRLRFETWTADEVSGKVKRKRRWLC